MWSHHADHPAQHKSLHVEPYHEYLNYKPKPDFYLSAADAPYPIYQELTDPALVSYYEKPVIRKILLQHGIIHPKDYGAVFGSTPGGTAQTTQETLRKVSLLMNSKMKRAVPERQYYPYLPTAMRRLVHAGAKMSDRKVRAARSQLMTKPLDYVIIRLEEQLRAVKHAVYLSKQPTVAKNMLKFGFTGFVYKHSNPNSAEDKEKEIVLHREQDAVWHFQDRMNEAHEQHDNRSERLMNDRSYEERHLAHGHHASDKPVIMPHSRLHLKHQRHGPLGTDSKGGRSRSKRPDPDKTDAPVKVHVVQNYGIKMTQKFRDALRYRQTMDRRAKQLLAWEPLKSKKKRDRPFWMGEDKTARQDKETASRLVDDIVHDAQIDVTTDLPDLLSPSPAVDRTVTEEVESGSSALSPMGRPASPIFDDRPPSSASRDGRSSPMPHEEEGHPKKGRSKKGHKKKAHRGPKVEGQSSDMSVSGLEDSPSAEFAADETSPVAVPAEVAINVAGQWGPGQDHEYQGVRQPDHFDPFGHDLGFRPHNHVMPKAEMNTSIKEQLKQDLTFAGTLHPPVTISGVELGFQEDESHFRLPPKRLSSTLSIPLLREHVALTYEPQLLKQSIPPEVIDKSGAKTQPVEMDPLPRSPSGTWHWRELQAEQEAQRAAQLRDMPRHLEEAIIRVQKHDDGLYRFETESSHIDMNVPAGHGHHDKEPGHDRLARPTPSSRGLEQSAMEHGEPLAQPTDADHWASDLHSFGSSHPPRPSSPDAVNDHAVFPIHDNHNLPHEPTDDVKNERNSFTYDSTHVHDENRPLSSRKEPAATHSGDKLPETHVASELRVVDERHPPRSPSPKTEGDHEVRLAQGSHHDVVPGPTDEAQPGHVYDPLQVQDEDKALVEQTSAQFPPAFTDPHALPAVPSGTWSWREMQKAKEDEARNTTIHPGSEREEHIRIGEDGTVHFHTDSSHVDLQGHPEIHENWPENLRTAPPSSAPDHGFHMDGEGQPIVRTTSSHVDVTRDEMVAHKEDRLDKVKPDALPMRPLPVGPTTSAASYTSREKLPDAHAEHLASDLHSFGQSHPPRTSSPGTEFDHGVIPIHENHHVWPEPTDEVRQEHGSFTYDSTHVQDERKPDHTPLTVQTTTQSAPPSASPGPAFVDPHALPEVPSGTWSWREMQKQKEDEAQNTAIHPGSEKEEHIQFDENGTAHYHTDSSHVDLQGHPEIHEDWPKNLHAPVLPAPGPEFHVEEELFKGSSKSPSHLDAAVDETNRQPGPVERKSDLQSGHAQAGASTPSVSGTASKETLPAAHAEHLASDLHSFGETHPPRTSSPGTGFDHGVIPIHDNHHVRHEPTEEVRREHGSFTYDSTHVQDETRPDHDHYQPATIPESRPTSPPAHHEVSEPYQGAVPTATFRAEAEPLDSDSSPENPTSEAPRKSDQE